MYINPEKQAFARSACIYAGCALIAILVLTAMALYSYALVLASVSLLSEVITQAMATMVTDVNPGSTAMSVRDELYHKFIRFPLGVAYIASIMIMAAVFKTIDYVSNAPMKLYTSTMFISMPLAISIFAGIAFIMNRSPEAQPDILMGMLVAPVIMIFCSIPTMLMEKGDLEAEKTGSPHSA